MSYSFALLIFTCTFIYKHFYSNGYLRILMYENALDINTPSFK